MPHFKLMDEAALGPIEGPLLRARLHIRGGARRLRQEKISAGIAALYDALEGAMRYYIGDPGRLAKLAVEKGEDLNHDKTLYAVLVRSRVINGKFDFEAFDRLLERALHEEMPGYDYRELLVGLEAVMTQLGVMPFDESLLPPEDPKTY